MHNLNRTHISQNQQSRLYSCSVPIIGITGSIATGKSSVTKLLRKQGFKVIDADNLIRNIYKESETLEFLELNFSTKVIQDNKIDFKKLREVFFADNKAKKILEEFLYKRLPEAFIQELHSHNRVDFIFYDVPLLFEKNLETKLDKTAVVFCPRSTQVERLTKRDKITLSLAQTIIDSQIDIDKKKSMANFLIDNSSSMENLEKSVDNFLSQLFL